jgi:protein-tyrosine-phosphatase
MAECLLRDRLDDSSAWRVASAGTAGLTGVPASREAVSALDDLGLDLRPHRSQALTRELVDEAVLIVVMSAAHRDHIGALFPGAMHKVVRLKSFDPDTDEEDVADPIGSPVSVYRVIRDEIAAALPGLAMFMEQLND